MNTKYIAALVKVGEAMKLITSVKETSLSERTKKILDALNEATWLMLVDPEKISDKTEITTKK